MISKCGSCQGHLSRVDTGGGKPSRSSLIARWVCDKCGRQYQQKLRQPRGPIECTTLRAKDNLGVSATKFGPLYVDTVPGSGRFFISLDLGAIGGLRLRLSTDGWKAETVSGSQKGTWE